MKLLSIGLYAWYTIELIPLTCPTPSALIRIVPSLTDFFRYQLESQVLEGPFLEEVALCRQRNTFYGMKWGTSWKESSSIIDFTCWNFGLEFAF